MTISDRVMSLRQWKQGAANFCVTALLCCLAASSLNAAEPLFVTKLPDYDDAVYAPVYVNGKPHLFVIDSGFNYSLLHSSLRESLGEAVGRFTDNAADGSPFQVETFVFPAATMGTIELTGEDYVGCSDLTAIREATGRDIEGVLGIGFFKTQVIQLDFDKRELRILEGTTSPPDSWGSPISVSSSERGSADVAVWLGNEINEQCKVDTGDTVSSLSLAPTLFSKLVTNQAITLRDDANIATAAGLGVCKTGTIGSARIGPFENRNLSVSVSGVNCLGLPYFRRFLVTFDLGHQRMYLAKAARFDRPDEPLFFGAGLLRIGKRTKVEHVVAGSAAEKAGVKANDELIEVAETNITIQPIAEIHSLISERGKKDGTVDLTIRRDENDQHVTVRFPK